MDEQTRKLLAKAEARAKSAVEPGGLKRSKSLRAPKKAPEKSTSPVDRAKSSTRLKPSMRKAATTVKTMSILNKNNSSGLAVPVDRSKRSASFSLDNGKKSSAAEEEPEKKEGKLKPSDSLEKLMAQVNQLSQLHPKAAEEEEKKGEENDNIEVKQERVSAIVNVFTKPGFGGKKSLKDIAQAEIRKQPTALDNMMMQSKVVAAFGRRNFDVDEIDPQDEEEEEPVNEDDIKERVKHAKPKYLDMFNKKEIEAAEEKKKEEKEDLAKSAKALGAWDQVTNLKVLPTLMRVKKEWVPPDWDKIMEKMKEEGRDVASIDADLREISRNRDEERKKTGKYLMPDDIKWCRNKTRFREKDLLTWFRRFRSDSPKGELNREQLRAHFKFAFPVGDEEEFTNAVFEILDPNDEEALDFKDFILAMDAATCKTTEDKLRWAVSLYNKDKFGTIDFEGVCHVLKLIDQIEDNGFINGPTDEDLDELQFRRQLDPLKLIDDRAQDIMARCELTPDGRANVEEIYQMSTKVIYARE